MKKIFSLFIPCLLVVFTNTIAQTRGILPLTGIQYSYEGISAKYIDVTIDGATLTNNRIPANKEFVVKLQLPNGFTEDASKKIYPAAEVNYLSIKKQLLTPAVNLLKDNERTGFASNAQKEIPLKLMLRSEWLKYETECLVQIKYYDLKSKKQMLVLFPVTIAPATEALSVTKFTTNIATSDLSLGLSSGLKMNNAEIMIDTTIRVSPKTAYLSIEINNITGTSMTEVLGGKNTFWVYDDKLNEIKIAEKFLKKVGGSMEDNLVNYTMKIPFRDKTDLKKGYTIRYRWESTDHKKIIDIVSTK
ncbi:MAG: hypothetical protein ABIY51_03305 [Ferruginibacter sp.]